MSHTPQSMNQEVNQLLDARAPPSSSSSIPAIWAHIAAVATAIMNFLHVTVQQLLRADVDFNRRIAALETRGGNAPSKAKSGGIKCTKCHARGHAVIDCKSKNPAAVRRRIASNNRKRQHPDVISLGSYYPFIAPASSSAPMQTASAFSAHVNPASIVAEAVELRRRAQQSQRDKRRARSQVAAAALANTPVGRN